MSTLHAEIESQARDAETAYRRGFFQGYIEAVRLIRSGHAIEAIAAHEDSLRQWREQGTMLGRSYEPPPPIAEASNAR